MNTDENRITRRIGNFCPHFQRHKIIAFARHDHAESFRLQNRAELSRDIQGKIFFCPITAHLPFVVTAVSGIEIATVGVILMACGALGLLISLFFLGSARRAPRDRTVVREHDPYY